MTYIPGGGGGGGGSPTGTAGGDLAGFYPDPTIANNAVTNAALRQGAATSVVGRSANSTGNVADITAGADGHVLRRSSSAVGFGLLDASSIGSGVLDVSRVPFSAPGSIGAVTPAGGSFTTLDTSGDATIGGLIDCVGNDGSISGTSPDGSNWSVINNDGIGYRGISIRAGGANSAQSVAMFSNPASMAALDAWGPTCTGLIIASSDTTGARPIIFAQGATGSETARFSPGKRLLIGTATDDGANRLQVSGSTALGGAVSVAGTLTTVALTASGAVNANSVTATGAVSGATVTATGAVSGTSVSASGAASAATLSISSTATLTGALSLGSTATLAAISSPGSPSNGMLWHDSAQKSLVAYLGGVKQALSGMIFAQTATVTRSNTASNGSIIGSGVGTSIIPANIMVAGKTVRIVARGVVSCVTDNTFFGATLKIGATNVIAVSPLEYLVNGTQNAHWELSAIVTCRTTGSSGVCAVSGLFRYLSSATGDVRQFDYLGGITTNTIDTTVANAVDVLFRFGTAHSNNSISCTICTIEILN